MRKPPPLDPAEQALIDEAIAELRLELTSQLEVDQEIEALMQEVPHGAPRRKLIAWANSLKDA